MTVPLPQAVRAKLNERADRLCEVRLPGCYINANNAHHRKNQSQGGLDVLSNLLLACGSGTTGCHGWITEHPGEAKRRGLSVWRSDDPALTPVMYRGAWARLDNTGLVHLLKRGRCEMSWVTCQSPTSGETFVVNTRNVRRVVHKTDTVSVLEFSDGTAVFVNMAMEEWLAALHSEDERQ
jgi:hypothetical protein